MKDRTFHLNEFDLVESESGSRIFDKLHLGGSLWKLALIIFCLTWLPLFILSFMEGSLTSGSRLPFLKDISIQGRLLVGVPMMILIRKIVYRNVPPVLQYFSEALIYPDQQQKFLTGPLKEAKRSTNSRLAWVIFSLFVIGISFINQKGTGIIGVPVENDSWFYSVEKGSQQLSSAGLWAKFFSLPVFQLLLLIWFWRYLVWTRLLYRISGMDLKLLPTHPDGSGGLGIFVIAQRNFIMFFITCGIVISCGMIGFLVYNTGSFELLKVEILGFVGLCVIILFSPLLFFAGKLFRTKREGLLELSMAGSGLSEKFEKNWVSPLGRKGQVADEPVDPSMQYDYSGIYLLLQSMRIIPIKPGDVVIASLLLFIPFIPVFFIQFSIIELLQKLLGLLI
jgi:hypothetical protein